MGNLCGNSNSEMWLVTQSLSHFESASFGRARLIAAKVVRSKRYFDSFKKLSGPSFQEIGHEEFLDVIDLAQFHLDMIMNVKNYGSSTRATTNESQALLSNKAMRRVRKREIFLNVHPILRILGKEKEFSNVSDADLEKVTFVLAATLVHEASHILNFVFNFDTMVPDERGVYRTPPGPAGQEFGEAIEISLFGEICWLKLNEPVVWGCVEIQLISKSGLFEITNVSTTMLDLLIANPETEVQLETKVVAKSIDISQCSVSRRFCYDVDSPTEGTSALIH